MTDHAQTLGQRLRAIRESHGFTQTSLSRALGGFPTPSAISRLEADQVSDPGIYTLAAIARVYGMRRVDFFREIGLIEAEDITEPADTYAALPPREKIAVLLQRHPDLKAGIAHLAGEPAEYVLHVLEGIIQAEHARKQTLFEQEEERAYGPRRQTRKAG